MIFLTTQYWAHCSGILKSILNSFTILFWLFVYYRELLESEKLQQTFNTLVNGKDT